LIFQRAESCMASRTIVVGDILELELHG